MTHWIGGIGIIVFILAIIPMMGGSSGVQNLFSAEISGPTKDKIHSKTASAAKILIAIYVGLTAIETILLYLGDMSLYDAVCHSFSTIGTGGFSTKNNSIIGFSNYTKVIITVFMFLAGINYGLYYFVLKGRFKKLTSNSEFKGYLLFTIASIIALSAFLFADNYNPHNTITDALQNGAFMAVSVITTTGFSSTNYDFWLHASSFFLLILFFTGASSGSSTGGIKMSRYVLMFKNTFAEFRRAIHPRAVIPVKYNGNIIETSVIFKVLAFFFLYILMVMIGGLIFYANGRGLMFSFSLAASAIGNIGLVIHDANAAVAIWDLSVFEKIFTSVLMIIGRLEIFTVLILFTPEFWRK
jgi:trk system potassium uptake protein TrkH